MSRSVRGALTAVAADRVLDLATRGRWERQNYRGAPVSLSAGPALVLGLLASAPGLPPVVVCVGAGLSGAYDDAVGSRDRAKGLRGHAAALRSGRLTGGIVKVAGIGGTAVLAVALLPDRTRLQVLLDAALVAGTANLLNLLDLRPGRALKVGSALGAALGLAGPAVVALALLPGDLRERTMLGDAGANALGALLGLGLVERLGRPGRTAALATVIGLTALSERVSFTAVIERTPGLRELDRAGRLR